MYRDYFGFREPPFTLTPNPDFLFLSRFHQEAFAHLLYAIDSRAGFIELSGEVGTGKTTIIRTLLGQLAPETHRSALILNPTLSPVGLLQEINREFGIFAASSETRELHQALNEFLLKENEEGRIVVLVIDEAQNLAPEVLEQVRLISNLETTREKLIQIVLVGQPELSEILAREELRQLNQRITVRYHLNPMEPEDVHAYIRHRIKIAAGGREPVTFSTGAVKKIAACSGGLPRLINGVCDRAILLAYTMEVHDISASMASLAIKDLRKTGETRRSGPVFLVIAAMLLVLLVSAAALLYANIPAAPPPPPPAPAPMQDVSGVKLLQQLLQAAGHYSGPANGIFDARTEAGVRSFQQAEQLKVDGRPGGQTLLRLYQRTGGIFPAQSSVKNPQPTKVKP